MKNYWTRFLLQYPKVLVYMLQSSEYDIIKYIQWLNRTNDFRTVIKRKDLDYTNKAKLLLLFTWLVSLVLYAYSVILVAQSFNSSEIIFTFLVPGIIIFPITPLLASYLVIIPLWLGETCIQKPLEYRAIENARQIIQKHQGFKIAIAGSYGKTTAKEVLTAILREGKIVASTPGNMNTMLGISKFAQTLKGNEDVLIFELGEGKPGDIRELASLANPSIGIITGICEAHLEKFGTVDKIADTIFELKEVLGDKRLYKNAESEIVKSRIDSSDVYAYTRNGVCEWQVNGAKTSINGTQIEITDGYKLINATSKLIGYQNLGIIVVSVAIAESLGLGISEIEAGINNTVPFEHRMQPRSVNGAWIIDDTYNGNSEGVKAGLEVLKAVEASRRIYVTPGLVEQGEKTREIHEKIGQQIAVVADIVVLMKNSVTEYIQKGLTDAGYAGKLQIIENPLEFYHNIDHYVAAGDVVLMQNDWTDNYN